VKRDPFPQKKRVGASIIGDGPPFRQSWDEFSRPGLSMNETLPDSGNEIELGRRRLGWEKRFVAKVPTATTTVPSGLWEVADAGFPGADDIPCQTERNHHEDGDPMIPLPSTNSFHNVSFLLKVVDPIRS